MDGYEAGGEREREEEREREDIDKTWSEREQRICRHCDLQQIEDEKHFLMIVSQISPCEGKHFSPDLKP